MKKTSSRLKRNLYIIGLKRSGTTIFWETFRQDKRFVCFDEPFHPEIRYYTRSGVNNRKGTLDEYISNSSLIERYWSPIQPFEEIYPDFLGHQVDYLKALTGISPNVCIDFVRCHAKIRHLREIDPDGLVIHLVRDPRAFVTSHLNPYGRWLSPELPARFFEYDGWFDFWQYQTIANLLGYKGHAHERLLQLWKYFTETAEGQYPDLTVQFEHFALHPEKIVRIIYELIDLRYEQLDYSKIHMPNPPYNPAHESWWKAIKRYDIPPGFLYKGFGAFSYVDNDNVSTGSTSMTNEDRAKIVAL